MARIANVLLVGFLALCPDRSAAALSQPDDVAQLLVRVETVIRSGRPQDYPALLSTYADRASADDFARSVVRPGVTAATLRERERVHLPGTLPGDGYSLTVESLVESGREARLSTWALDVKRVGRGAGGESEWVIAGQRVLGTIPSLFKLQLDDTKQFSVRRLVVTDEDLECSFPEGDMFVAEADGTPVALVVLGRGEMRFAPTQPAERGQLKLFSGSESLSTPLDVLFVRLAPGDIERHLSGAVERRPVDPRLFLRAAEVFKQEVGRSFAVDLGDLTPETWSLLPSTGDFLAELRTRKSGALTYVRSNRDAEDISLFERARHRNIAVYTSAARLATRGRFYSEDDAADYHVESYDIDASFEPARRWLEGETQVKLTVVSPSTSTITLQLADSLLVSSVSAREYGRLLAVRVRGQNAVVVSFPAPLPAGLKVTLDIAYSGTVTPQAVDREAMGQAQIPGDEPMEARLEESYLYSNQTYWYPQAPASGYATATLHVRVPQNFSCVASGELVESAAADERAAKPGPQRRRFTFVATRPARYFACLITPLAQAASRALRIQPSFTLQVRANPRLQRLVKPLADTAGEVLEYYASLMGDSPYPDATVAAIEWKVPGGHSPAYMAVLNQPVPGASSLSYRNDPAYFEGFPEFFIAHELAHQWWGQAVGWKNYHEQWLSEGLSQYFAALYAGHVRGPSTFESIMRRFRQTSADNEDQGPIYLGYRAGHIKGDSRVFRAVVYNKSAAVLHMLHRLVGDEAFYRGLRRFYTTYRFQKAGSDDLRRAMEAESGQVLGRFFEQWIYGDRLPDVTYSVRVEDTPRGLEAVVRFEQVGQPFDVPVTVSVDDGSGRATEAVAAIRDTTAEVRLRVTGPVRKVEVNKDSGALGRFTETRGPKE
jgi:hypothetical protein